MIKTPDIGKILINLMIISQALITLSLVISYFYSFFLKEDDDTLKKFHKEVKPVQLVLGAMFISWWIRSNNWKNKTLPVDTNIRMTLFQYSLITIYIAFDLVVKYWHDPEIIE